ncbi:MAG: aldehyde ferredoxin oxidoreductase N-terminal domain-containing protein [Thermosphaera aggregans]|uniref:aldehyde ferredoxin oxidoreductase N-terminal domain-containing protein n=1 Tax=Thermosphaera aggregans TaxID=54254 RepID=UPI003C0DA043
MPGREGIASYILFKELKPGIDPLRSENKLVCAISVITGKPIPGVSRIVVAAKSPLTGTYGESEANGLSAPGLKYSGFDVVVV